MGCDESKLAECPPSVVRHGTNSAISRKNDTAERYMKTVHREGKHHQPIHRELYREEHTIPSMQQVNVSSTHPPQTKRDNVSSTHPPHTKSDKSHNVNQFEPVRQALLHNPPIEEKLHVIMAYTNPLKFHRRYILAKEFIERMQRENQCIHFYIVEMVYYPEKEFVFTQSTNPSHLQLTASTLFWHKENMINLAIQRLLPRHWKAVAWIDADIEFQNPHWAIDTLRLLNHTYDIVQLFSHCDDMELSGTAIELFASAGYHAARGLDYSWSSGPNYSHPGYAWAMTRQTYERLGGLIDINILGSGDWILTLCLFGKGDQASGDEWTEGYREAVSNYQFKAQGLRFGYVPGVINHYFHGKKANRKYNTRAQLLIQNGFDPRLHLTRDARGVLIPTARFPEAIAVGIRKYFAERKEDDPN